MWKYIVGLGVIVAIVFFVIYDPLPEEAILSHEKTLRNYENYITQAKDLGVSYNAMISDSDNRVLQSYNARNNWIEKLMV
jgi:predicted small secreted protein